MSFIRNSRKGLSNCGSIFARLTGYVDTTLGNAIDKVNIEREVEKELGLDRAQVLINKLNEVYEMELPPEDKLAMLQKLRADLHKITQPDAE